jgi:hypothetical protein
MVSAAVADGGSQHEQQQAQQKRASPTVGTTTCWAVRLAAALRLQLAAGALSHAGWGSGGGFDLRHDVEHKRGFWIHGADWP